MPQGLNYGRPSGTCKEIPALRIVSAIAYFRHSWIGEKENLMLQKTALAILFVFTFWIISYAQDDKSKRPSPPAQAQCEFSDGKTITVDYSSPRVRGRKIFDELVPYGKVWRTGANEATTFVTNENLITVKGTSIPPGSYTIFTVPNSDTWTLIINKHTGQGRQPLQVRI